MHPLGCMEQHIDCPTCHEAIVPISARGAKLVNAAMWVFSILLAVAAAIPLIGIAVLPLWFLALWGLGVSASQMSTAYCPVCRHEVGRPTVEPAAIRGPLVAHHA